MQVLGKTIPLFIQLPGRNTAMLLRSPCEHVQYVGDVIKAAIAEFKRLKGVKADELLLYKIEGSSRILLVAGQTLSDAGVNAGTTLSVEFEGAASISMWCCVIALMPPALWTPGRSFLHVIIWLLFQANRCASTKRSLAASP